MKIIATIQKDKDSKILINHIILPQETENITHQLVEVEQLEEKQGYYISYEYDENQDKIISKYIEIPKTKEELLEEEIIKIKKAIAEQTKDIDLDELETLNSTNRADLSELDTI